MSLIYMNNAATSWPKPLCVAEAVARALSERPGAAHRGGVEDFDVFSAVRKKLAPRLGVSKPDRIALGSNATWALNTAIFGLSLSQGDVVLTTKAEHNSIIRPLHVLEQNAGVKVIYLDTDGAGRVPLSAWQAALFEHRPKLAVFTHASNVTGAVNDASSLAKAAKAAGALVLLDASQTLGWIPLHAESWGVDMVAFTGHKYLLGPQGTGGLWVRENLQLAPHLVGGTGIHSDRDTMPEAMPLRLEAGTGNEPSFHGLLAALTWAEEHPLDLDACNAVLNRLKKGLVAMGASVVLPEGDCTPVVSFNVPGYSAEDVGFMLTDSYGIVCRTGLHCAPRVFEGLGVPSTVRLSLSRFTTEDEMDEAVRAVGDIIG
jgi:cysteine desulfurase/selenocysteine lyase